MKHIFLLLLVSLGATQTCQSFFSAVAAYGFFKTGESYAQHYQRTLKINPHNPIVFPAKEIVTDLALVTATDIITRLSTQFHCQQSGIRVRDVLRASRPTPFKIIFFATLGALRHIYLKK